MQLHIQPAGQKLEFEAGDNLLETLRRGEIQISYSCLAGRCGTCRCKILSGSVQVDGTGVTGSSEAVLACQATLTEACTIEIPEPDEVVVHPARTLKGTIESIDAPVHDVRILRCRTNRPLSFSPGQFANIQFGTGIERPYSMACVEGDDLLEFHIRIVPGGRVSSHIAHLAKPGDTVRIAGPLGTSYLRRNHDGPIICVGGGTGLAPVLSIVRASLESGNHRPVHVYFGVRTENDAYGADTLAGLKARYPNLRVHIVIAQGPVSNGFRVGLVPAAIEADWPDSDALRGFRAYVCGSPPMVDAVSAALRARGLQADRIYADAFFTQQPPAPVSA